MGSFQSSPRDNEVSPFLLTGSNPILSKEPRQPENVDEFNPYWYCPVCQSINVIKSEWCVKCCPSQLEPRLYQIGGVLFAIHIPIEIIEECRKSKFDVSEIPVKPVKECIVCFSQPHDHVITTCGHKCLCGPCGKKLTKCPVCRKPYNSSNQLIKVFEV